MAHVVLLGDSVFDNARYVPGELPVVDQLRGELPAGSQATLLAVDGHVTADVASQLGDLPDDATHLVVSVGGNDALSAGPVLYESVRNVAEGLAHLHEVAARFRHDYHAMLQQVLAAQRPTGVCTIYDAIPGLNSSAVSALTAFNDAILREAFAAGLPVVDLRLLCDSPDDYSHVSPIEPSAQGGAKIARAVARLATCHDFAQARSAVYV
jgi:hypothetical protein